MAWRRSPMALFPQDALNPGVRKREVFGWAMYDFANSGYTTVVITAVFAAYFVGGIAGQRRVGHVRLDGRPQRVLCDRHGHHAQHRRLCRPARGQEATAGLVHRGLRALHRRAGTGAAGQRGLGDRADRPLQHLLFVRRVAHRRFPARTGAADGAGQGQRLGLELRLLRRHAGPGPVPGLRHLGPGTGHRGQALRAGDHADHRGDLRRCGAR